MQTEREKTTFQLDNMWGMPGTKKCHGNRCGGEKV